MSFDIQLLTTAAPDLVALEEAIARLRRWSLPLFANSTEPATALRWIERGGQPVATRFRTDYV